MAVLAKAFLTLSLALAKAFLTHSLALAKAFLTHSLALAKAFLTHSLALAKAFLTLASARKSFSHTLGEKNHTQKLFSHTQITLNSHTRIHKLTHDFAII